MRSNPSLWQRIQAHTFDEPGADMPFTDRLCLEQGWPKDFALRALEEYRRFAYLACVAGREMTPSREVDAVWHLHLTYSRDYWEVFCAHTLGMPLHHTPTSGGKAADQRYRRNYEATRQHYAREFGEQPPADLWPPAHIRFAALRPNMAQGDDRPNPARRGQFNALQRLALRQSRAKKWLLSLLVAAPLALVLYIVFANWGPPDLTFFWFLTIFIVFAIKAYLSPRRARSNTVGDGDGRWRDGAAGAGILGTGFFIGIESGDGHDGGGGGGDGGGGGCGGCGG